MAKFKVVLVTRTAGIPQNIRIETTAASQKVAENNALYLFRKHGHSVFNVSASTFRADLKRFMSMVVTNRPDVVIVVDSDADELWIKAVNLRAFLPRNGNDS